MSLTVLSVAYVLAPVGPDTAGGAEQVLATLDRALVAAGHRSLVVACTGSKVEGELLATAPLPAKFTDEIRDDAQRLHRRRIEEALQRWPIDVVHCHGLDFAEYLPPPGVPTLVTLHLPADHYQAEALTSCRAARYFNCVSASQRRRFPETAAMLPEVSNGVPVAQLQAHHAKRNFVLAMGRICPEKGFHCALDAAALARIPLLLAGQVFPYEDHTRYFAEQIRPHLGRGAQFLGNLDFARKRRFLSAARCLLMPSLIAETSSLVAMEAIACGTPVVAFPVGALPEIVEPDVTGFLVHSTEEMADAIRATDSIDRERCRAVARTRFSTEQMVASYFRYYEHLAALPRLRDDPHLYPLPPPHPPVAAPRAPPPPLKGRRGALHVERLTTETEVERLSVEWEGLWRRCPGAAPFQSPHWLLPWWKSFGNAAPRLFAAYSGSTLAGVLPLYLFDEAGRRKLLPFGVSLSDYIDALVDPEHPEAIEILLQSLAAIPDWDQCYIPELAPLAALLSARCPAGLVEDRVNGAPCPVLSLPSKVDALREMVPRKTLRDLRQARRRTEAAGEVSVTRADGASLAEFMPEFFRLHERRWQRLAGHGIFDDPKVIEFHLAAAQRMLDAGMLRIYLLHLGQTPLAAYYGFYANGIAYAYLSGFDPDRAELSPGTQIVGHAIEEAVREGAREFHFLRGGEAYKYAWGAVDRINTARIFSRRC